MQHLVDSFDTPAYAVHADPELTIAAWNSAAEQTFRWAVEEAVDAPVYERLGGVPPAARRRRIDSLRRRDWWTGRTTLADRDGIPLAFRGMCWSVLRQGAKYYVTVLKFFPQFATIPHNAALHETRGDSWQRPPLVQGSNPMTTNDPITQMIGVNIRRIRRDQKVSQEKLALMLGKHRQHVSAWENARIHPNSDNLQRIADTLKVPVGELFRPLNGK
jgi:DNA-binding XRE family transcriptional regulator